MNWCQYEISFILHHNVVYCVCIHIPGNKALNLMLCVYPLRLEKI